MVRTLLIALAMLVPVALPSLASAAPPRNRSVPPSPAQLRWEIIAYQRGSRTSPFVIDRLVGSEAQAGARAAYYQTRYPKYLVAYRKAR